jgi:hypothetical protein
VRKDVKVSMLENIIQTLVKTIEMKGKDVNMKQNSRS